LIRKINLVKFTPEYNFPLYKTAQSDFTYDDEYEEHDVTDVIFDDKVTLWIDEDFDKPRLFEIVFHHLIRQGYKPVPHNGDEATPIQMSKSSRIIGVIDQAKLNQDSMINEAIGKSKTPTWNRVNKC
jgi:hypothetical protein